MFRSWKISTLFGIGIYVHATFLLLPLLLFFINLQTSGLAWALYAVMMIPAVFACVVLHELGHALTARHYGIGTRDITLYPIGGVARLESLPQRPLEEFWIAVAGPAVNVAIATVLAGLLFLIVGFDLSILTDSLAGLALLHLIFVNVVLVVFNMLPAFPMDGGRVLRALLATRLGQLQATTIAAQIGVAMAVLFGVVGLFARSLRDDLDRLIVLQSVVAVEAVAHNECFRIDGKAFDARGCLGRRRGAGSLTAARSRSRRRGARGPFRGSLRSSSPPRRRRRARAGSQRARARPRCQSTRSTARLPPPRVRQAPRAGARRAPSSS